MYSFADSARRRLVVILLCMHISPICIGVNITDVHLNSYRTIQDYSAFPQCWQLFFCENLESHEIKSQSECALLAGQSAMPLFAFNSSGHMCHLCPETTYPGAAAALPGSLQIFVISEL